ncbi:MAG: MauE/DoxX family redox-associated membrane protein [Chloroflexota bacterium]
MRDWTIAVALLSGVIFVSSGTAKLVGKRFRSQLAAYRLVPGRLLRVAAIVIPALEVLVGVWLLSQQARTAAFGIGAGLIGMFTVAVIVNLVRGRRIPCACAWDPHATISPVLAGRNIVLIGILSAASALTSTSALSDPGHVLADCLILICAGLAAAESRSAWRVRGRLATTNRRPRPAGGVVR